jgi:hypothetical protein
VRGRSLVLREQLHVAFLKMDSEDVVRVDWKLCVAEAAKGGERQTRGSGGEVQRS